MRNISEILHTECIVYLDFFVLHSARTWSRSAAACDAEHHSRGKKHFKGAVLSEGTSQKWFVGYIYTGLSVQNRKIFVPDLPTSFTCCSLCHIGEWFWVTSARAPGLLVRSRVQDRVGQQQNPYAVHIQVWAPLHIRMWAPVHQLFCPADPLLLRCNTCIQGYSQTNLACMGWTAIVSSDFLHKFWG